MRILIALLLVFTGVAAMALDNGSATRNNIPASSGLDAARSSNPLNRLLRELEGKEMRGEITHEEASRAYWSAYDNAPKAVREEHDRLFEQMLRDMEVGKALTDPNSRSIKGPAIPDDLKDAW